MAAVAVVKQAVATVVATAAVVMAVAMGEGTAAPGVVTAVATAVVVEMEMETGTAMAMVERIPASRAIRSIRAMCRCPTWIHPFPAATKGSGPAV